MHSFSFNPSINSTIHCNNNNEVHFYAIQQPNTSNHTPEIWTDAHTTPSQWHSVPFQPINPTTTNTTTTTTIWHAKLTLDNHHQNYSFTYRLRSENHPEDIIWLGLAGQDGQIINSKSEDPSIRHLLLHSCGQQSIHQQRIKDDLHAIHHHLFTLRTTSSSGQGENSITFQNPIHLPDQICNTLKFDGLAFVRSKPTWFDPYPFVHLSEISASSDTQLIIIHDPREDEQKNLLILIPISTSSSNSTIRSTSHSPLTICTTTTDTAPPPTVKLMIINGPQSKLKHIIHHHLFTLDHLPSSRHQLCSEPNQTNLRNPKKLGYCTWDSLGPDYKLSEVIQVLESFQKSGIIDLIDRVLLDDGWQDVNGRFLSGWGIKHDWMDVKTLENGQSENSTHSSDNLKKNSSASGSLRGEDSDLARAVNLIRHVSNQSIKLVGVWVTITGYWCGLDPQSEIWKEFHLQTWSIRPSPQPSKYAEPSHWMLPKKTCIRPFWNAYFTYLKSAGVQFIKIDNQAGFDRLIKCESDPTEDVEVYKTTLIDVVDDLARRFFGTNAQGEEEENAVINSMAHSPQIWFREHHSISDGSKGKNKEIDLAIKKKVMRTSDDFFPDLTDLSGHQWHIVSNSFNAILANGLGFVADFDMTMTKHQLSDYHAAFRVFTNAQIYITDRNGEHDLSTCEKLTAPLRSKRVNPGAGVVQSMNGAGCVLSSNCLGQPAKDLSLADSPWGLLKVGLSASYAGGGLIGIWNVKQNSNSPAVDVITARDIAETILSDQPGNHQGSVTDLVIFCDDQLGQEPKKKSRRRMKVISDFDSNLEMSFPQFASRPVIGTTLSQNGSSPINEGNSYEIWRVCRLLDLLVDSKEESMVSIQVASLGLLNQFAGLCAVMTGPYRQKATHPKMPAVESRPTTHVVNGVVDSDQAAPLTNGQIPPTHQAPSADQRGVIWWMSNMIGWPGLNQKTTGEMSREPVQTGKIGTREVIKFMLLLAWKSVKSIVSYFVKQPSPSGVRRDPVASASPGPCSERTPLLDNHTSSPFLSLSLDSTPTEAGQQKGLEFHTLFTAPLGFIIRLKSCKSVVLNNELLEWVEVLVDNRPVAGDGIQVEVLNDSEGEEGNRKEFLMRVDLSVLCCSRDSAVWSVCFRPKK